MRFAPLLFLLIMSCQDQQKINIQPELLGNNIRDPKLYPKSKHHFLDPVDDTVNFKRVATYGYGYSLYKGPDGKAYLTYVNQVRGKNNTTTDFEYLEASPNIDTDAYKDIGNDFFISNNKVWFWFWGDYGYYPLEVFGADPKTFASDKGYPKSGRDASHQYVYCDSEGFKIIDDADLASFEQLAFMAAKDKNNVYYGTPESDHYDIVKGADPASASAMMTLNGAYIADNNAVYFLGKIVNGADPRTFETIYEVKGIDAKDKNGKYFKGNRIK